MDSSFLEECTAILTRTPQTLDTLLRGLPDVWTQATEGPATWSPYDVVGHLIHGELTDWIPRIEIILQRGPSRPFDVFDREAQFTASAGKSLPTLLDEFIALRQANLDRLRALHLQPEQLDLEGMHQHLGLVTLRQLLATWVAHDLGHIVQITRVMAKRLKPEIGPWTQYLSVMN